MTFDLEKAHLRTLAGMKGYLEEWTKEPVRKEGGDAGADLRRVVTRVEEMAGKYGTRYVIPRSFVSSRLYVSPNYISDGHWMVKKGSLAVRGIGDAEGVDWEDLKKKLGPIYNDMDQEQENQVLSDTRDKGERYTPFKDVEIPSRGATVVEFRNKDKDEKSRIYILKSWVDTFKLGRGVWVDPNYLEGMVLFPEKDGVVMPYAVDEWEVRESTIPGLAKEGKSEDDHYGFGSEYGTGFKTPDGTILRMHRKGQRVRFYDEKGNQVGPEQSNVAPAVAYALAQGWEDISNDPFAQRRNQRARTESRKVNEEKSVTADEFMEKIIGAVGETTEEEESVTTTFKDPVTGKDVAKVMKFKDGSKGDEYFLLGADVESIEGAQATEGEPPVTSMEPTEDPTPKTEGVPRDISGGPTRFPAGDTEGRMQEYTFYSKGGSSSGWVSMSSTGSISDLLGDAALEKLMGGEVIDLRGRQYKAVKKGTNESWEEDDDNLYQNGDPQEPQEEDLVMEDVGMGSTVSLSIAGGKHLGKFQDREEAEKAARAWMKKNNFYPNLWHVNDHGNANLVTEGKIPKGMHSTDAREVFNHLTMTEGAVDRGMVQQLDRLYKEAESLQQYLPKDTPLANILGNLRDVEGSEYYRAPPRGSMPYAGRSKGEIETMLRALRLAVRVAKEKKEYGNKSNEAYTPFPKGSAPMEQEIVLFEDDVEFATEGWDGYHYLVTKETLEAEPENHDGDWYPEPEYETEDEGTSESLEGACRYLENNGATEPSSMPFRSVKGAKEFDAHSAVSSLDMHSGETMTYSGRITREDGKPLTTWEQEFISDRLRELTRGGLEKKYARYRPRMGESHQTDPTNDCIQEMALHGIEPGKALLLLQEAISEKTLLSIRDFKPKKGQTREVAAKELCKFITQHPRG